MLASVLSLEIKLIAYAIATGTLVPVKVKMLTVLCHLLKVIVVYYLLNVVVTERLTVFKCATVNSTTFTAVTVYCLINAICSRLFIIIGNYLSVKYTTMINRYRTNVDSNEFAILITVCNGNGCCGSILLCIGTDYCNNTILINADPIGTFYRIYIRLLASAYRRAYAKAHLSFGISQRNIKGISVLKGETFVSDANGKLFACKCRVGCRISYIIVANTNVYTVCPAVQPILTVG